VPVGCVIVRDGRIIAKGFNLTNELRNVSRRLYRMAAAGALEGLVSALKTAAERTAPSHLTHRAHNSPIHTHPPTPPTPLRTQRPPATPSSRRSTKSCASTAAT